MSTNLQIPLLRVFLAFMVGSVTGIFPANFDSLVRVRFDRLFR